MAKTERFTFRLSREDFLALNKLSDDMKRTPSDTIRTLVKSAQHRLHVDVANAPQAGATCPHCGNPIVLVAPETPRQ